MANDVKRIEIGAATISFSAYVTAGGAGSFTDAGYTEGAAELEPINSNYDVKPEQVLGAIMSVPIEFGVKLKFAMREAAAEQLQWVLRQPAGSLSGTGPNRTLLIGDPSETYQQMKLVTKGGRATGGGAQAAQTWTFWRCVVESVQPIGISKDKEKIVGVTMNCLYDESVSTADKYGKVVNTGGT